MLGWLVNNLSQIEAMCNYPQPQVCSILLTNTWLCSSLPLGQNFYYLGLYVYNMQHYLNKITAPNYLIVREFYNISKFIHMGLILTSFMTIFFISDKYLYVLSLIMYGENKQRLVHSSSKSQAPSWPNGPHCTQK